jgi:peptide/nickel transport system ATP-binding protein
MAVGMLQLKDVRTEIDGSSGVVVAVDGVSLAIQPGETFALVGESGCGKSMTAMSIARLLPENARITQGAVLLEGTDLAELPEHQMRRVRGARVAVIFQEPATSLNPVLTVCRQITESIEAHTTLRGRAARAKAIDWLRRVGIPEPERNIDAYPFQLSGGQKQRVMIAIALAAEPSLLIADEPTTALDVTIQKQILELLKDLQRETNMAMLLITHDLGIVRDMAQTVALMYAGEIVELAPVEEFFGRPLHPYARMLFAALPDNVRRGERLAAIGGTVPSLTQVFTACRFIERCPSAHARCQQPVALTEPGAAHYVRCVLHEGGVAEVAALVPRESAPATAIANQGTAQDAQLLLQVRDFRVWFPIRRGLLRRTVGHVKAVDGVSFELAPGRTLALVGESGCGKTTIGKALLQLLRQSATIQGQALLDGQDLTQLKGEALRQARRRMQIIFQDPFGSLNPRMRVVEILEEGVAALRPDIAPASRRDRIAALVERVGLRTDSLTRYPHEFSGGQRQRLAIARALAVEPQLIICDEPTSALDVSVQAQILNLLRDLQAELGVAYLFITHNFGVVEYLADEIVVLRGGRVVEAGAADHVLQRPQAQYTRELLAAVPRVGASRQVAEAS